MIRKILIAEDHENANISLQKTLTDLAIQDVDIVYYCDDALRKIEKQYQANNSYDLLITDLHFEPDHRAQQLNSGVELIGAAKKIQPDLKILVFSAERKPATIQMLLQTHEIDGYVPKARHDADELKTAIGKINKNERHLPDQFSVNIRRQHLHEFSEYDRTIIALLANGVLQKNIPSYLRQHGIQPAGLSSVEKRLNLIRETLKFQKNEQLVIFCKDMGII